jgi:hypothetical protein
VGAGAVLATLAAGAAQAATPELSVTQRLEDRREVAAGTRAQVLGFQDGRFYANGWHITGEMGGIVTPPLKLLDSVAFRVNDTWVPPATEFTSGAGYVRYEFPSVDEIGLERVDVAPDGHRGALLGLRLTNPKRNARRVNVFVDAHSELMTQYPWGFTGTVPNASDNRPDRGRFDGDRLIFRDTGTLPNEGAPHSYTALVGSNRSPVNATLGQGFYGANGLGRRCVDVEPKPMPSDCDDGPFGKGTGGRLHYRLEVPGGRSRTLWVAVAGSENSPAEARAEYARLTGDPARLLTRQRARRERLAAFTQLDLPADRQLEDSVEWGKQNLRDLTQVAEDVDLRWTDQGKKWDPVGSLDRMRWVGAGFPDYPWLFGVDGEYTAHASVALGQFGPIKDHMRALRDISDQLSGDSGVVVHEVVADGSIWYGKDERNPGSTGAAAFDFNTDEIVKFPAAVALIWRWTGDDGFRDEMLDFTRRNLEYVASELDEDGDGWPEGNGNVEREGMGPEKLDNAVYYIRALYDYADMASSAGDPYGDAADAEALADGLHERFEAEWWMEDEGAYADSLGPVPATATRPAVPAGGKINQKHWIGADPMEAELWVEGEVVPGLADFDHGSQALATRENDCYSGVRPGNLGLYHTGCGGGPAGAGEFAIFSLGTGIMSVGEGNYGRLGQTEQQRYTSAAAETQFSEPATNGTPDEQPGAMPEIFPSEPSPRATNPAAAGTPPNIDRCWTCRSMFMQSWGHYGTSWAVVHQELGIRPSLGRHWLEVVPQLVDGAARASASNVRLGRGAVDVHASRDGSAHTTKVDGSGLRGVETLWVGHTLPRDTDVASVELDGAPVGDYEMRLTSRGLEVRVEADPPGVHTLVVTAG